MIIVPLWEGYSGTGGEGWVGPVRPNNDQSPEIAFFVVVVFFFESHNDFIF